jgi:hypothetical protein
MKRISITLFAAILFIAATLKASAQETQSRQVSGFNGIASSGSFNVHVKIDGAESLKITADKNIINEIETVVEDGVLKLRFKKNHDWNDNHYGKVEVEISAKNLSSLSLSGSGKFDVDGSLTGEVKLAISGSGNISTGVKAEKIHAAISGSGNVTLNGSANDGSFAISGSGNLKASELKIGTVSVSIAGSGSVHVNAEKSISGHIAGSGNLYYTGNAQVTDFRSAGSGSIRKGNE